MAKAKLTVSVKRRLANGDEVFIAPGLEMDCTPDALDETQLTVTERLNAWMETMLEAYPDADLDDEEDEEEADEEIEEEDEDEDEEDEDEDEEDEDELEISEEDIAKMKLSDLKGLIKEAGLKIDPKGMKVADLREAVLDALFEEEGGDEEDEEDEEELDEEEEADEEEADEDEITEEDLQGMKLKELQALCDNWGIGEPDIPKGTKLADKKDLYVEYIMENAEE